METEITANPENTEGAIIISEGPNNKRKQIMALVVSLAIICGAVYAYAVLDMLKSPKQIYLEAESTNLLQIKKQIKSAYDDYVKLCQDNPIHNNIEMTFSLKDSGKANLETGFINIFLQQCKVIVNTASDEKQGIGYTNVAFNVANRNLFGIDYLVSPEQAGVAIPALYDNYLYINFADRDILQEKFGIEGLPRKIVSNEEYRKVLELAPKEKRLFIKYAKLYRDCLDESQVSLEKGTFAEGERQINCRKITVSFDQQQSVDLAGMYAETMAQDDPFLELVCNKQQQILQLCYDSGYNMEHLAVEVMDKNKLKEALQSFKDKLSSCEASSTQVVMTLYVDSHDNILDRQVTIGEDDNRTLVRTACWKNQDKNTQAIFHIKNLDEAEPGEFRIDYTGKKIDSKSTGGQIVVALKDEFTEGKFFMGYIHSKEGQTENFSADFSLFSREDNTQISGEFKSDVTFNKNENKREGLTTFTLNLDGISEETQNKSVVLNFKHTKEFNKPVELPVLDNSNSQNLAEMSEEDLARLKLQIEENLEKLRAENYGLLQSL